MTDWGEFKLFQREAEKGRRRDGAAEIHALTESGAAGNGQAGPTAPAQSGGICEKGRVGGGGGGGGVWGV